MKIKIKYNCTSYESQLMYYTHKTVVTVIDYFIIFTVHHNFACWSPILTDRFSNYNSFTTYLAN